MKTYKKHTVYKLNDEGTSTGEPRYQWITDDNMSNQQIPLAVGNADYDRIISEIDSGEAEIVEVDDTDYPNYAEKRRWAYPDISDQLDMLWHAVDGDDALKTTYADFHTAIKTVKDANPKG